MGGISKVLFPWNVVNQRLFFLARMTWAYSWLFHRSTKTALSLLELRQVKIERRKLYSPCRQTTLLSFFTSFVFFLPARYQQFSLSIRLVDFQVTIRLDIQGKHPTFVNMKIHLLYWCFLSSCLTHVAAEGIRGAGERYVYSSPTSRHTIKTDESGLLLEHHLGLSTILLSARCGCQAWKITGIVPICSDRVLAGGNTGQRSYL